MDLLISPPIYWHSKNILILVETNIRYEIQADYVAEMVRKVLYEEYGNSIYTSGLKVITTIKKRNQEVANQAVENGIINYMNRQDLRES